MSDLRWLFILFMLIGLMLGGIASKALSEHYDPDESESRWIQRFHRRLHLKRIWRNIGMLCFDLVSIVVGSPMLLIVAKAFSDKVQGIWGIYFAATLICLAFAWYGSRVILLMREWRVTKIRFEKHRVA